MSTRLYVQVWLTSKRFGVPEETSFTLPSLQRARPTLPETPDILTALQQKNGRMSLKRADTDSVDGDSDMDSCRSPTHTTPASGLAARCSDGSPQHPSPGHRPPMESQQSLEMQGSTPCIVPSSFLGVRRLLAEIVDSAAIVSWLECALDSCSHMVNLREVIGSHRRGPMPSSQMRPEFSRLRQAFERDAVALARYCLLTTYTAYLHHMGPKVGAGALPAASDAVPVAVKKSFKDWLASLHSVQVRSTLGSFARPSLQACVVLMCCFRLFVLCPHLRKGVWCCRLRWRLLWMTPSRL